MKIIEADEEANKLHVECKNCLFLQDLKTGEALFLTTKQAEQLRDMLNIALPDPKTP